MQLLSIDKNVTQKLSIDQRAMSRIGVGMGWVQTTVLRPELSQTKHGGT